MKSKIKGHSAQTIFESIRELVVQGQLNDQEQLPSVRELGEQLKVNRNTISAAYKRLVGAGIAQTQGRLGTRICRLDNAGEQEGGTDTHLFDLADGSPRIDWLPPLDKVAKKTAFSQYTYGESTVLPGIEKYARTWFKNDCPRAFSISLTNGAIDAMERIFSAHLVAGDTVVVEDPCYISSANAIRLSGLKVCGCAVDAEGMCFIALRDALQKGAKAVLITPRAHNPTGVSLTESRANAIKQVLKEFPNVVVLLDDHFALMSSHDYFNVLPKSTYSWALFRSVSKGLGPDLRLAIVAGDKETINRINTRLAPGMSWVSRVLQSMVYTCLTQAWSQKLLKAAQKDCTKRRQSLLDALTHQGLPSLLTVDGLNVWINVNRSADKTAFELAQKGWLVRPCNAFDINRKSQSIRVSIQKMDKDVAQRFVKDLKDIV